MSCSFFACSRLSRCCISPHSSKKNRLYISPEPSTYGCISLQNEELKTKRRLYADTAPAGRLTFASHCQIQPGICRVLL